MDHAYSRFQVNESLLTLALFKFWVIRTFVRILVLDARLLSHDLEGRSGGMS